VEDPARRDADEDLGANVGERLGERGAVIAGVEDEQRHLPVRREPPDEPLHLGNGGVGGVHLRAEAQHVCRRGPGVLRPTELADPLIAPPGHDRLAGRVLEAE